MKSLFIVFCFLTAHASTVFGGTETHGGNTVVCRAPNGSIKSVRLLDFYEGEILFGLKIPSSKADFHQQAREMAKRLDAVGPYSIDGLRNPMLSSHEAEMSFTLKSLKFLPRGARLAEVPDSGDLLLIPPASCKVEQTALFTPDGFVHIVSDYWNKMSETDRAGLMTHEVIYLLMRRETGATTSKRARKITAYAFSNFPFVTVTPTIKPKEAWFCSGNDVAFFAWQKEPNWFDQLTISFVLWPQGRVYSRFVTFAPREFLPIPDPHGSAKPTDRSCSVSFHNSNFETENLFEFCRSGLKAESSSQSYYVDIGSRDSAVMKSQHEISCLALKF